MPPRGVPSVVRGSFVVKFFCEGRHRSQFCNRRKTGLTWAGCFLDPHAATPRTAPMGQSLPAAEGWLYKRHEHKPAWGKQWAKRYVTLNAKRGTLAIGKS